MSLSVQIAKHVRDLHFGGNWTAVNLRELLSNITWEQATKKIYSFNTILALTYHINYFIKAQIEVLSDRPLTAKDKFSFDHPEIKNQEHWNVFLEELWKDAEEFANLIEQLPDKKLDTAFFDPKYGNYFRNLMGVIEHSHYHIGQITIIKKILLESHIKNK